MIWIKQVLLPVPGTPEKWNGGSYGMSTEVERLKGRLKGFLKVERTEFVCHISLLIVVVRARII